MKNIPLSLSAALIIMSFLFLQGCVTPMAIDSGGMTEIELRVRTTSDHFQMYVEGINVKEARVTNKKVVPGGGFDEGIPNLIGGAQGVDAASKREEQSFTWILGAVPVAGSESFYLHYNKGHMGILAVEITYADAEGAEVVKKFHASEGGEKSEGEWRIPLALGD